MLCPTLHQLYQLSQSNPSSTFSPAELVRWACTQCSSTEVCPAVTDSEYDARHRDVKARKPNDQD